MTMENRIKPFFWQSLLIHLVLLGLLISPWNFFLWDTKTYQLEKSLRVDLVTLPEILAKDRFRIFRPKKSSPRKKLLRQQQVDKAFKQILKKNRQRNLPSKKWTESFKGNVLSPGTHLRGIDKIKYDRYLNEIDLHVKRDWFLPEWLKEKNLKAQIKVKINNLGKVIDKKIIKPSGNNEYDHLILNIIEKASPFPAPPHRFKKIVLLKGFILGFPE